jgi:hypothetical protein
MRLEARRGQGRREKALIPWSVRRRACLTTKWEWVGEGERALVREPPPDQAGGLAQSLSELGISGVISAKLPAPIGRPMRGCIKAGLLDSPRTLTMVNLQVQLVNYVLAPVDRGGATSTPRNSCSFRRKIIIKTGICSLRPGEYNNTCFPEILDYCGGITRKSCDPCKKQGPKHNLCRLHFS